MHGPRSSPWRLVIWTLSPFLHYIVCASVDDYNANEEWCVAALQALVEKERLKTQALLEESKREAAEREREMEEDD